MSRAKIFQDITDALANWVFLRWPKWVLNWQNQNFFASSIQQACLALLMLVCLGGLVPALWRVLVTALALSVPSAQWLDRQQWVQESMRQSAVQQTHALSLQAGLAQQDLLIRLHQAQVDDLLVAWPNSAIRLTLLHRLHGMAQQRGLLVQQLKLLPEPAVHGLEVSSLKFSVQGTEDAVHAYWQDLDQWLQNGLWTSWVCRRQADGRFVLEGQLSLYWDAQDADTDTGVALQFEAAALANLQTASAAPSGHVLPKESQSQMRVVGVAQSSPSSGHGAAWTWVRSGSQTHLVRSGQQLGIEQSQAKWTDAQGLWLSSGPGQPDVRLDWEGVKP
jgi:hypothetical protein